MSVAVGGSAERLDIGQALQELLSVLLRNFVPFTLLGLLLSGVPMALLHLGIALGAQNPVFALLSLLGVVAIFVTRPVLYGALIFGTVRRLDGEPASLCECLAAGWGKWGTMLGLMIWSGLLICLGWIFLVVPGVLLALQWAVAGPSVVFSRRGISDSMDESARLTKGRRWAILLFYVIFVVGLFIASLGLAVVEGLISLVGSKLLMTVLEAPLSSVLFDVSYPVVGAVLYRRLRGDAGGAPTAALAEVFA